MAPRRGGGGSGGGGGGSSSPTAWNTDYMLSGDGFEDPVVAATVSLKCVLLVVLLGIAFWSLAVKTVGEPTRRLFNWYGFGFAIWFLIL